MKILFPYNNRVKPVLSQQKKLCNRYVNVMQQETLLRKLEMFLLRKNVTHAYATVM